MWKDDPSDIPSGSSNPEGSDTNPGPTVPSEVSRDSTRHEDTVEDTNDRNANSTNSASFANSVSREPSMTLAGASVPEELSGNMYAVLYDEG